LEGKRKTLYEEVWECRFPRQQTAESPSTPTFPPGLAESLHLLFKDETTDPPADVSDDKKAKAKFEHNLLGP
jgi:hypothetical protein